MHIERISLPAMLCKITHFLRGSPDLLSDLYTKAAIIRTALGDSTAKLQAQSMHESIDY
ncbi:hypothetical protein [Dyella lipolytica]|uniref:Uncharacterized protein n=1 Tax=Dyella lipolytica TaxID=1867835 RepID=A0ABW8ITV0_9GAMM|nr:hypothetical protein [Dyella lipolytica]